MSKPVVGKPEVDDKVEKAVNNLNNTLSASNLRNCNRSLLRSIKRSIQKALADAEFYLDIRDQQALGGVKGNLRK